MTYQPKRAIAIKYLKFELPSNHRWTEHATCLLETGKRVKYAFEYICIDGEIKCLVLLILSIENYVTSILVYKVELSNDNIL